MLELDAAALEEQCLPGGLVFPRSEEVGHAAAHPIYDLDTICDDGFYCLESRHDEASHARRDVVADQAPSHGECPLSDRGAEATKQSWLGLLGVISADRARLSSRARSSLAS